MSGTESKYINLKEAAKIFGYAPDYLDYIGQLIRKGKLPGRQIFCNRLDNARRIHKAIKKDRRPKNITCLGQNH
ncbi:MAG: hypothetical protein V1692_03065 [bacterium]